MITKPIYLYPDSMSISPEDNILTLTACYPTSCSLERFIGKDGLEYCYGTLFIMNELGEYRIHSSNADGTEAPFYPRIYDEDNMIRVVYEIDLSRTDLTGEQYYVSDESVAAGKSTYINIKERALNLSQLKTGKIYRWKIRVYEKGSILNPNNYIPKIEIGYGTLQGQRAANGYYEDKNTYIDVEIFGHTNVHDKIYGSHYSISYNGGVQSLVELPYFNNNNNQYDVLKQHTNIAKVALNAINKIDPLISYYLSVDSNHCKFISYTYAGHKCLDNTGTTRQKYMYNKYGQVFVDYVDYLGGYDSSGNFTSFYEASEVYERVDRTGNIVDSYGNPISGHALLKYDEELVNCEIGTPYKITCNFIDSDEAYFEMYSVPKISIIENTCSISFTNKNGELIRATENSPYVMDYCNLDISLTINQNEGVESDSFNYRIYKKDAIGNYEEMFFSGNIYSSDLRVKYDDLLDNSEYKIAISIFYSNNTSTTTDLYFNTKFAKSIANFAVKAEYCREHGSLIVEWDNVKSINPDILNNNYEFVNLGERKMVYVGNENKVTYYKNDFGTLLNFDKSVVAVKFKPTELSNNIIDIVTNDNKYTVKMARLENVDIGDCQDGIIVTSGRKSYTYSIKSIATTEETIQAMTSGVSPINKTLVWHNDMVWSNTYKWFNGQNTTDSDYLVIITPDGVPIVKNLTLGIEYDMVKESIITPVFDSASKAILYENTYFQELTIINHFEQYMIDNLLNNEWVWTEQTQLLVKFNGNFNGAALETADSNSNLVGYKVYKKIGNEDRSIYKIADIDDTSLTVCEDFLVGANCEYQYYVYPMFSPANNEKKLSPNNPAVSDVLTLNYVPIKTVGLSKIDGNIYTVDIDNVWRFELNVEDNGYTLNNSKTFMDSLNRYNQEYVGNLNYITKDVSGLIGMIDCYSSDRGLIDTYDILTSWNKFSTSANLKCLIDSRGLILPGNFEQNPSVEYEKCSAAYASVKFNYRQKSDLDIIQVYATVLPFNPLHNNILQSSDNYILTSKDNMLLLSTR